MNTKLLESTQSRITVVIKSRKKTLFDGDAIAVSSINETGVFDVLPQHANFITMVKDYIKITLSNSNIQEMPIKSGVMRVIGNKVSVYLTVN